jgi:16S rRNA (cytidine1402-2'-O)-methyltransferase
VAALVASGLPTDQFLYLGYLSRKATDRRRQISAVSDQPYTLIFLETPHRLLAACEDLFAIFGDRQIAVARELTKRFEEIFRGTITEAATYFKQTPPRGEITLVVAGASKKSEKWTSERVQNTIQDGLDRSDAPSQLAKAIAAQSGWPRRKIYNWIIEISNES